jgi:hypothetical protein
MRLLWGLLIALSLGVGVPLWAQQAGGSSAKKNTSEPAAQSRQTTNDKAGANDKPAANRPGAAGRGAKPPALSPEREAAAQEFVRQHHPELADLLTQLKISKPREFDRAMQELARTSERVSGWQERDPERYQLELDLWKVNSQARLLAARLMMGDNSALVEELRTLIAKRKDLELQLLLLERDRVSARSARLDAAIERARQTRDQQIQTALDQVIRGIDQSRPKNRPRPKEPSQP